MGIVINDKSYKCILAGHVCQNYVSEKHRANRTQNYHWKQWGLEDWQLHSM